MALVAVHVGHLFAVRNEGWGTTEAPLSLALCRGRTCESTGGSTWATSGFPSSSRCSPLVGLFGRRFATERLALLAYFVLFFGIDLLFYAGSYNYGADVRYSLMTYPPLAILGGLGLARIVRWLERLTPVLPAHGSGDGRARVPVSRGTPARPCDHRGSVGGASGRAVCEIARPVIPRQLVRADPQSRDVSGVGVNAGQMSLMVSNPATWTISPIAMRAASTCTGISGATSRIPFSGSSAGTRSRRDRRRSCASTANEISATPSIDWLRLFHEITTIVRSRT